MWNGQQRWYTTSGRVRQSPGQSRPPHSKYGSQFSTGEYLYGTTVSDCQRTSLGSSLVIGWRFLRSLEIGGADLLSWRWLGDEIREAIERCDRDTVRQTAKGSDN